MGIVVFAIVAFEQCQNRANRDEHYLEGCDMLHSDSPLVLGPSSGKCARFAMQQRSQQPKTLLHKHNSGGSELCLCASLVQSVDWSHYPPVVSVSTSGNVPLRHAVKAARNRIKTHEVSMPNGKAWVLPPYS